MLRLFVFTFFTHAITHPYAAHWSDTKPINAHRGGAMFSQGVYYWYGEAKSGKTYLPDCNKSWGGTRVDLTGVSSYASTNLVDWKNEGIVLSAVPDDPQSDLHPSKVLERPKVIYNRNTRQFVMWMHIDSASYAAARCGVAVSDKPTGPFKYLGSVRPDAGVWPENITDMDKQPSMTNVLARDFETGQMARDMTVFVDDDGKAYLFYSSEENPTMHVSLLTDDYLHTSGKYARIFIGRSMEAPAVFNPAANTASLHQAAPPGRRMPRVRRWRKARLVLGLNWAILAVAPMQRTRSTRKALSFSPCKAVRTNSFSWLTAGNNEIYQLLPISGCRSKYRPMAHSKSRW